MGDNSKKPGIRFKGFTDDWEQRKLGEIITEYKETVDSECTLPILTSSKTEGVILQEEHFGRKQQHDITGYNILPRNYCTYRNRSDGVDFTFNINKCCDKGIISKFYPVFSGKNSDVFFLSLVLNNSDEVVREIAYTCTGTGQKVLSFLDLQKMKVRVPSYDEQKEIAAYFENLDHLITLHQRKYDKLVVIKKSMLEKMFPKNGQTKPEIRFSGFTDDWEQRKLGEVLSLLKDGTHGTHQDAEEGPYLLSAKNIKNGQIIIDDSSDRKISEDEFNQIHTKFTLENGDILLTIVGSIGESAILENVGKFTFQRSVAFLRPSEEMTSRFLKTEIESVQFQKELNDRKSQSAQPGVYLGDLSKIPIYITSKEEQKKIGECFSNLDHLITLHQRELEKLKKIKLSMLEKMFV